MAGGEGDSHLLNIEKNFWKKHIFGNVLQWFEDEISAIPKNKYPEISVICIPKYPKSLPFPSTDKICSERKVTSGSIDGVQQSNLIH